MYGLPNADCGCTAGSKGDVSELFSPAGQPVHWKPPPGLLTFYATPGHAPGQVCLLTILCSPASVPALPASRCVRQLLTLKWLHSPTCDLASKQSGIMPGFQAAAAVQVAYLHHPTGILLAGDLFRNRDQGSGPTLTPPSAIFTPNKSQTLQSIRAAAGVPFREAWCCHNGGQGISHAAYEAWADTVSLASFQ